MGKEMGEDLGGEFDEAVEGGAGNVASGDTVPVVGGGNLPPISLEVARYLINRSIKCCSQRVLCGIL
ncbi:MAG: hypothetical protein QME77_10495, partial [bacterium]|nr:hypothetical protein [bacterium]